MTPREAIDGGRQWILDFYTTVTSENVLDWPITYILAIVVASIAAFYALIFVCVVAAEVFKESQLKRICILAISPIAKIFRRANTPTPHNFRGSTVGAASAFLFVSFLSAFPSVLALDRGPVEAFGLWIAMTICFGVPTFCIVFLLRYFDK